MRPSRTSSPERLSSRSFRCPCERAKRFSVRVSAERKPERCVPPSCVLMLFANERSDSWYELFHWSATSTSPTAPESSRYAIFLCSGSFVPCECR